MDRSPTLTGESRSLTSTEDPACPRCGEPAGALRAVSTAVSRPAPVRRCGRCGSRYTTSGTEPRIVVGCAECGLPFAVESPATDGEPRCEDCRAGRIPGDLHDGEVTRATEGEIRAALHRRWTFVGAPTLSPYLDRLARRIARQMRIPRAGQCQVVLFEDARLWTLALPSATLLVSLGTLLLVEDEAELAFVLGHELAHTADSAAAMRMVRVGFDVLSRDGQGTADRSWASAAYDLISLGYGRAREREADRSAFDVLLALGYDPRAVVRYLDRLRGLMEKGDPRVADLALAHPRPEERLRQLEQILARRPVGAGPARVNREVFRRVAGHNILATRLRRIEGPGPTDGPAAQDAPRASPGAPRRPRPWLLVLAAALLALLWLLLL